MYFSIIFLHGDAIPVHVRNKKGRVSELCLKFMQTQKY